VYLPEPPWVTNMWKWFMMWAVPYCGRITIHSAAVYGMPSALYIKGFFTIVTFNCEDSQLG